jgi:diadenosine tetraphosphate (Ap4A) HIT family hydrolase
MNNICVFCKPANSLLIKAISHFYLLYDPYPLTPGHLLIASREHFGCGGEIEDEHLAELELLKLEAINKLSDHFSKVIIYEHGRAGACHAKRSEQNLCHHMHLHLLPFAHDLHPSISELASRHMRIPHSQIIDFYHCFGNYLYYERGGEELGYFYPVKNLKENLQIPPHFLRTLIATLNQTPERANWESYPSNDLFQNSHELLACRERGCPV